MKMRMVLGCWVFVTGIVCSQGEGTAVPTQKIDSLKAFQVLITTEISQKNRVMVLKNGQLSDSLLLEANRASRTKFEKFLADSSIAREVKTQEEFVSYWKQLEAENGIKALKDQLSRADIDKSLIPKKYLFDSSVVIYPGVIILRKRLPRHH